jgi:hypothetical protein
MSLHDLDNFITANHHLPEIPTDADVSRSGVGIGNMTGLLLKKVEEITRYVIEQKKEIEALKATVESRK